MTDQATRFCKATISYDGTDFCGWQIQARGRSVQGVLEDAWRRFTLETLRMTASGRTDSGVHARGQVISFATTSTFDCNTLRRGLNAHLPDDVRVLLVDEAPTGFHAIRNATGKQYRYLIQDGGIPDVFLRRHCWFLHRRLDVAAMTEAAAPLLGKHDFRAFQASGSERKTTTRTLRRLDINRRGDLLEITTEADGYLYNMVRNLVGTLIEVGRGKRPITWPYEVLATKDRQNAGQTAPAQGLCLEHVSYDSPSSEP